MADATTAPSTVATDAGTSAPPAPDTTASDAKTVDEIANESIDIDAEDFAADDDTEGDDQNDDTESEESEDEAEGADDTEAAEGDESDTTDDKPDPAEERKQKLSDDIRKLVATRNELKKSVAAETERVYTVRSPEDLMQEVNPLTGENFTATEAEIQSMKDANELRDYNDQVAEAQLTVSTESDRVLQDFPIFDEKSPTFNKEIAEQADVLFGEILIRDTNTEQVDDKGQKIPGTGQIIGTHLSPYKLYKLIADAANVGTTKGEIKGAKNVKKMLANADTVPGNGPKTPTDKGLEAFDKELDRL